MVTAIDLRSFEEADFAFVLRSIRSAKELLRWAGPGFSWPLNEQQLTNYRNSVLGHPLTSMVLSATERVTAEVVGHVQLVVDPEHDGGQVGRVLVAPEMRGRGIGTVLMREVVRVAFDELQLHRLTLNVFDFNDAAIACYERVGFITEGRLRDARRASDRYWSLVVMGILSTDPRPAETAPRQLTPSAMLTCNFAGRG